MGVEWARRTRYSLAFSRTSSSVSGCHSSDPTRPVEDTTAIESVLRCFLTKQLARVRHLARSPEGRRGSAGGEKGGRTAVMW